MENRPLSEILLVVAVNLDCVVYDGLDSRDEIARDVQESDGKLLFGVDYVLELLD